jgi:CheY-like chemotaxis protein
MTGLLPDLYPSVARVKTTAVFGNSLRDEVKTRKVRLLLVDDDPAVLKRASEFLSTEFEIAGFASDGAEALDAIERLAPDAIVLDIAMPVLDGLQTACRLRSAEQ